MQRKPYIITLEETQAEFARSTLRPVPTYEEFDPCEDISGRYPAAVFCCSKFGLRVDARHEREFGSSYDVGDEAAMSICRLSHIVNLRSEELNSLGAALKELAA